MTTGTTFATAAGYDRRLAAISEAARPLYDAEIVARLTYRPASATARARDQQSR